MSHGNTIPYIVEMRKKDGRKKEHGIYPPSNHKRVSAVQSGGWWI